MPTDKRTMIREEQNILNQLISDMDQALLELDYRIAMSMLRAKMAKEINLPEAYGDLIKANDDKFEAKQEKKKTKIARDALYDTRIVVDVDEKWTDRKTRKPKKETLEIKIGLHTYQKGDQIFILSWINPIGRHYILDNSSLDFENITRDKYGKEYLTHYHLKLRRRIDMFFDTVKDVTQFYPSLDGSEDIIADEFLKTLLNRRGNKEFQNIVFSIQRQQSKIIQLPYEQNLILQGCAGSGKSMIMLHRLPILLFDNKDRLERDRLYIITPSQTYIQMVNNMRAELEIEDLKMGTLYEYYVYVLNKYGIGIDKYGRELSAAELSSTMLNYIYSEGFLKAIKYELLHKIEAIQVNFFKYRMWQGNKKPKAVKEDSFPVEIIRTRMIEIQEILTSHEKIHKNYYEYFQMLSKELEEIERLLDSRKGAVCRKVWQMISTQNNIIKKARKELEEINEKKHRVKYENRKNTISAAMKEKERLEEILEVAESDTDYYDYLKTKAEIPRTILRLLSSVNAKREEVSLRQLYQTIEKKDLIMQSCEELVSELKMIEDPYVDFVAPISGENRSRLSSLIQYNRVDDRCLSYDSVVELSRVYDAYEQMNKKVVDDLFCEFAERMGIIRKEDGTILGNQHTPYIYLQILFAFRGSHGRKTESLVLIDEAQNVAAEEIKLIKRINNKVVFNLFGDIKQHVEHTKGITAWNELKNVAPFTIQEMKENYRNARQITDYCNQRFGIDMRAINLDGSGVHQFDSLTDVANQLRQILKSALKSGLSCIIVKNQDEANAVLDLAENLVNRIHNLCEGIDTYQTNRWNLMTVDQVKGLEFDTVIAVAGRMSENEKYITYTRALDELYIFEKELIDIQEKESVLEEIEESVHAQEKKKKKRERKKLSRE